MRKVFSSAVGMLPCSRRTFSFVGSLLLMLVVSAGCSSSDDYDIFASISGSVTDYVTGEPLDNASVLLSPTNSTKKTAADGTFLFEELEAQQYTITVQKAGYQPNRKIVTAVSGKREEVSIQLTKIPE